MVENVFCCSNDNALQKVTVALQGGQQPDITYQYGTSLPQLANAPGIMDLTERVQDEGLRWDDFFPGSRAAATVDGRVLGVPALIDNLAIVYNKDLFAEADIDEPTRGLDVGGLPHGGGGADRPGEEAVRVRVPGRRQRGHGVALRRDAVAGRAATS